MKRSSLSPVLALLVILLAASTLSAGCNLIGGVNGNGKVIKQDRKVGSFTAIDVSSAFKVYLTQGTTNSVIVEADENLMQYIEVRTEGNTLIVKSTKNIYHAEKENIYITFTELNNIDVSGAVDIFTQGKISGQELSISTSGASDGEMELAYNKVKISSSGASKLKLTGAAEDVSVDFSGASELHAYDYTVGSMDVEISGAGEAHVNVSKSLKASISGAGDIRYKGTPVIDQHVSGAGTIKRAEP